jgi:hypothetical protein
MKIPATDQQAGVVLPEDTYKVKVKSIEESTATWEGVEKPALKFSFEIIDDGDYDGTYIGEVVTAKAVIYPKLSPKAKLRQWAEMLLGHTLGEGEVLDTDQLIGKVCRMLTVTNRVNGTDGKTREYTNVDKLLPPKAQRSAPAREPVGAAAGNGNGEDRY